MEKKVISQFYHEHPLILTKNVSDKSNPNCYGCGKPITNLEMAYICEKQADCSDRAILHKKCGELPNQILHPQHSMHPLNLFKWDGYFYYGCDLCGRNIYNELGYRCSSCDFKIDIKCAEALIEERKELHHPSHPHHSLTLIRKPPFPFHCDGCGDEGTDIAYICSTCEFLLHKRCASLPDTHRTDGHHHSLSLIFSLPKKHRKYRYRCDVCSKYCDASRWAYFCGECRYIVHIKCAIGSSTSKPEGSNSSGNVIELPLHAIDISDKLITPFVLREKGVDTTSTSTSTCGGNSSSFLLEYYHKHPLSLVSEFTHKNDDEEDKDEVDEKGDQEEELKICDACVTPISSPPYYRCIDYACTYSIHSTCSLLPHTLQYSSSSNLNSLLVLGDCNYKSNKFHNFTLCKSKGRDPNNLYWRCDFCLLPTNGMGYECGYCRKKIDVKCASLTTTIRHASHTRCCHKPLLLTRVLQSDAPRKLCHGCDSNIYDSSMYCCSHEGCDFALHFRCALLPLSVTNREWDKHQLLLTSEACLDHPSDFFCEFCEEEMHPKKLMYHCRPCDASFHIYCLDTGSGYYRNIKFGHPYEMDGIDHPNHPLTFTCITLKKRCDICNSKWGVYTYLGFECASCYYVLCRSCGVRKLRKN